MKVEGRHAEIDETRLAVSKFKFLRWGEGAEWEAGCALINMQVTISPRACKCSDRALVVISLHALARRYERGQDNSDSATLRDIAAVMSGRFVESDLSRDVSVAIAGGARFGSVVDIEGGRAPTIRT
jgi:hypothetical protein